MRRSAVWFAWSGRLHVSRCSIFPAYPALSASVGVYINDTDAEIYEVQIDNPVQEKDGVRVELKGFYCENNMLKGDFVFTGEGCRQ